MEMFICVRCGCIRVDGPKVMCRACLSVEANQLSLQQERERNAFVRKVGIGCLILVAVVAVVWYFGINS